MTLVKSTAAALMLTGFATSAVLACGSQVSASAETRAPATLASVETTAPVIPTASQ